MNLDAYQTWMVCADCMEFMKQLPANSVDAIITDPPYGTASKTKIQKHGDNPSTDFNLEWDGELPVEWLSGALRVTVEGGALIAFTDNKEVTTLWNAMQAAGWNPLQTITWVKSNPPPQPRQDFCSGVETAIFARKPGKIHCWNGGGATVNWREFPLTSNTDRIHPTQKPLNLMAWLVRLVTPESGLVFDPFMGSGTTGVAAIKEGRRFVGCEIDATFAADAIKRIELAAAQGILL